MDAIVLLLADPFVHNKKKFVASVCECVVDHEDRPGDHGVRSQWLQSVNVL